jgi:hypothetical protein
MLVLLIIYQFQSEHSHKRVSLWCVVEDSSVGNIKQHNTYRQHRQSVTLTLFVGQHYVYYFFSKRGRCQ